MGHAKARISRIVRAALRVTLFFAIWTAAIAVTVSAVRQAEEHRRLAAEVDELEARYEDEFDAYAEQLAENERIATDEEKQVELLKERFGYTEPNETPIIILKDY
ncbi:hypothetical protein JW859_05375 [bacterium]|nr:hypothetical protein [bacterium]